MKVIWLVALFCTAASAQPTEPCGGPLTLVQGVVKTARPLTGAPKEDACINDIAAFLAKMPDIRTVTVELRTPDDQRVGGKALKTATRVADVLVTAGLAKEAVSAVVPRADGDEQGLKIVVRTAPPPLPTVQVFEVSGEAVGGREENRLQAKRRGSGLAVGDVYLTKRGGAVLRLPDDSTVRLVSDTKVSVLPSTSKGAPVLGLLNGNLFVETQPGGDGLQLVLDEKWRLSIAPGSRVDLTVRAEPWGWAVSVYEGRAQPGGNETAEQPPATPWIEAGQGSEASGERRLADLPRALLKAPKVASTFGKPLQSALNWAPVEGATGYRVELARDALFGASTVQRLSATPSAAIDTDLGSGRFFFRVIALDGAVPGQPSKVYSFTR